MKDATKRSIFRWIHIVFSIPILGYIYGPFEEIPKYAGERLTAHRRLFEVLGVPGDGDVGDAELARVDSRAYKKGSMGLDWRRRRHIQQNVY